jgi:hypothetical protein
MKRLVCWNVAALGCCAAGVVRGPCGDGPRGQELYVDGGRLLACKCLGNRSAKMCSDPVELPASE